MKNNNNNKEEHFLTKKLMRAYFSSKVIEKLEVKSCAFVIPGIFVAIIIIITLL